MWLEFDLHAWFLYTTHCLAMVNICAKLFQNPPMHDLVIAWTRNVDAFFWPTTLSLSLTFDLQASFLYASLCIPSQVISKYPNAWPSYSLHMKYWRLIWTNNLKCDLDLWPSDMVLVRITKSCNGKHLCQVISKYPNAWPSYSLDKKCWRLIMNNNLKCDLILTYIHGSCIRHIVLPWSACVLRYFKIPLWMAKL